MRIMCGLMAFVPVTYSSFIYSDTSLVGKIDDAIEIEAIGWVVPMDAGGLLGPMIWFSTNMGSGQLSMRPQSHFARRSLLQFSLDDENQMAMKFLHPRTPLSPIAEFPLVEGAVHWDVEAVLGVNGPPKEVVLDEIYIDLAEEDIVLSPSMFKLLKGGFPADSVFVHDSRLVIACAELTDLTVTMGEVAIAVREMSEPDFQLLEMKRGGSCPMNVRFDERSPVVGRAILEKYDIVFDGIHGRVLVIPKTVLKPMDTLQRFRLDHEFESSSESYSWRWKRSLGPVTRADFIFTEINARDGTLDFICLRSACMQELLPRTEKRWVGSPTINVQTDMLTVSDEYGWVARDIVVVKLFGTVRLLFSLKGYRMKRDFHSYIEGERVEYHPATGPKERGEFIVPEWPPVRGERIQIVKLDLEDLLVYHPKDLKLRGNPKLEVVPDENRIVITADSGEMECDRMIRMTTTLDARFYLDFRTQVCRYRQIDLGEPAYTFELLGRSQASADEIILHHEGGKFDFKISSGFSLTAWKYSGSLRSPDIRWMAAPVFAFDPETKRITITPSGEKGWEYSHAWEVRMSGIALLDFFPLPIRLRVPPTISLTDGLWDFVPADAEYTGSVVQITKDKWLHRDADGSFTLTFENVAGPIFTGMEMEIYVGLPLVSLEESGRLTVRSNGDSRIQFFVSLHAGSNGELEVEFVPSEFAAVGSFPAIVDSPGEACSICQEELKEGEEVAKTFCNHLFHLECLSQVEKRECPNCRKSLELE